MAVNVSFGGANYSVPEEQDLGWEDLTDYLVALSSAQISTSNKQSWRAVTAATDTLSASDDYAVGVNYAGACDITLPTGVEGQIFVIADTSGAAATNNITITGSSQNINGKSTYVIRSNRGIVCVQFGTTEWMIISSKNIVTEQSATNLSMIDASIDTDNTGATVGLNESCTFTFADKACEFIIVYGDLAMKCGCSKSPDIVDCVWDTSGYFLTADAGTGILVTKSSDVVTVKNRYGAGTTIKIIVTVGRVTAVTAWS
jgi:hypothetical protein